MIEERYALREISHRLEAALTVVVLFLDAILGAPAVFDVLGHAFGAHGSGFHRIICALVISGFLGLQSARQLDAAARIIKALGLDKLGLRLALASPDARALAATEQPHPGSTRARDGTGLLVSSLPTLRAYDADQSHGESLSKL